MKLSEYIEGLKETLEEHGDLECYAASDSEGNSYNRVYYAGSVLYTGDDFETPPYILETAYNSQEEYDEEYGDDYDDDEDQDPLTPICIVN